MDGSIKWGSFYCYILSVATTVLVILLATRGKILEKAILKFLGISYVNQWRAEGGLGGFNPPPRNSEFLTKSNRIAN